MSNNNYIDFNLLVEPVYPRGVNRQCFASVRKYVDDAIPGTLLAQNAVNTFLANPSDRERLLRYMNCHDLQHVIIRVYTVNPDFYWCFPVTKEEVDI